jgi:hypothetical protein
MFVVPAQRICYTRPEPEEQCMALRHRTLWLLFVVTVTVFGAPITFTGPVFPKPGPTQGLPCNPVNDIGCIIGDPLVYEVFNAQLTAPTAGNPNWMLTIQTNYGDPLLDLIPGSPDVVPTFLYEPGGSAFSMGDFLFTWNGSFYGVVLHPHDGYQAGNLYQASGFQTSGQLMAGKTFNIVNATFPIWLAAGGTQQGTGTLTGAVTGDGVNTGKYTLTANFSAPAGFLGTGSFGIDFSSYVCGNGVLIGSFTSGGGGDVPEPTTLLLCLPGLLLVGFRQHTRRLLDPGIRAYRDNAC